MRQPYTDPATEQGPDGTPLSAAEGNGLLEFLYMEHGRALQTFVTHIAGGDTQTAEDVVQETMMRAWRNAKKLDLSRESLRPWLFTVARRIFIDHVRARAVRPQEVDALTLVSTPADDVIDQRLSRLAINAAMATLTASHRDVVVEMYFNGRSVAEAAAVLDVPPGTVKSRLYYALRALRSVLEERGESFA